MNTYEIYTTWLENDRIDEETRAELQSIATQPIEIEDRFYKQLEFGTGGIRGVLGAGRNRINRYTIRRITAGLAQYIHEFSSAACDQGVVIAYDSRHQSRELALETALTLKSHNIKAYIFENPSPTPLLSFAVRKLHTIAGIVITASHNPPEYNGYKVYWEDGGQIVPHRAEKIAQLISDIEDIPTLIDHNNHSHEISWLDTTLEGEYISQLTNLVLSNPVTLKEISSGLKIVYTPLHGTGGHIVKRLLQEAGFANVFIVPEQEQPDPTFSTVKLPNPETKDAFELALVLGESVNADLILASDPDCDRVGVLVKNGSRYEHLTGNQVGALLLNDLLSTKQEQGTLPSNGVMIKTIVTSNLGSRIAAKYNVETIETLTGFKYIGEKIDEFEKTKERTFLFGYEESCGYLMETFVRDKDGIMAILLLCEMAARYKQQGKTLYHELEEIYHEHGTFLETLESRTFKGKDGMEKMKRILEAWRCDPPKRLGSFEIMRVCDYLQQECTHIPSSGTSKTHLPRENALHFTCTDSSWFCLRPSGTEPKLKVYCAVQGVSQVESTEKLTTLVNEIMRSIDSVYR